MTVDILCRWRLAIPTNKPSAFFSRKTNATFKPGANGYVAGGVAPAPSPHLPW